MSAFPKVSVLIVSWNARSLLEQCLPSVAASTYPNLEIIVADNASTDDSVAWIRENYPKIKIVQHPENWAFCKGNNEAIPHATGTYIVLLNNDVEVPPDWLQPLIATMEADLQIGAAQPKLLQYTDRTRFEYAGASGGFLDRYGYPFARGRVFFSTESDAGQYDDLREIAWASGAALVLRKSALDVVGLLDERFFMHMEELDLCWRLARHGWRTVAIPESHVYHIGGGSLPPDDPRKIYYNFRNSLLLLYKNLAPAAWRRVFPRRVLLDSLALLRALFQFKFKVLGAILRAYGDAHRMKTQYRTERPTKAEMIWPAYRRSVVWAYFVRRKRQFQDLEVPKPCGSSGIRWIGATGEQGQPNRAEQSQ